MSKKQQEKQSIFPPTNVKSKKKSKDCEDKSKWDFCLSVAHVKPNDVVGWGVYFEPGDAFSWG